MYPALSRSRKCRASRCYGTRIAPRTGMTERTEILLERVEMLPGEAHGESRRREDLIEQVVGAGHSREYADQIYDVAVEESCDPVLAIEVVLAVVGVRDLLPPSPADPDETQVEAAPAWIE